MGRGIGIPECRPIGSGTIVLTRLSATASYRGRLAPAPTGALHLGNARTFVLAWLRARQAHGSLLLRLEDLDHPKVRPEAALEAYRDLTWLGLDWDYGPPGSHPANTLDDSGNTAAGDDAFVQSRNLYAYREALRELAARGLAYPCVCSRKDLDSALSAPNAGEDTRERRYPGTCRGRFKNMHDARLAADGREPGWRFRIDDKAVTAFTDAFFGEQRSKLGDWSGDFLVGRGDMPGYQLAVVVDDARMGVTEIVRGSDLLPSTHRQLAIYDALGIPPPAFHHVPLVVGPDGRRLAKRHGDSRLSLLREAGSNPERVLGWIAWTCGWNKDHRHELSLRDITNRADFSLIPKENTTVTPAILHHLGFPA